MVMGEGMIIMMVGKKKNDGGGRGRWMRVVRDGFKLKMDRMVNGEKEIGRKQGKLMNGWIMEGE